MEIPSSWRIIASRSEITTAIQRCADEINERFRGRRVVVVCILKGAVFFWVDLVRLLTIPNSSYFIEATSYHGQTQSKLSILSSIEPSKFVDREVILVDELYDNGHTLEGVRAAIIEKANVPPSRIFTCTLFQKNKSSACRPPDLYGILVPDVWLVGYGLDDRQEMRGLTTLWAKPKEDGVPKTEDDKLFDGCQEYGDVLRKYNLISIP